MNIAVPEDLVFADPVMVEIYDKNNFGRDTLCGVAVISHEELVFPHDHPGEVPIRKLDQKDRMGWLQIHIETSRVPRRAEPRRRPDEAPLYLEAIDPRNEKTYWYDKCTGEQFDQDPRPYTEALAQRIAAYENRLVLRKNQQEKEEEKAKSPALILLRAKKGFPEPPPEIIAIGLAEAAKVSWTIPRENGPPILGYTVERQRCIDNENWRDKGSIYIDSQAQIIADTEAAKAIGKKLAKRKNKITPPPTAVLVDQLADDAKYRFRVYAHNARGKSVASKWSNEIRVSRPLPPAWIEVIPKDGSRSYYYNAKTFESSWQRPESDPYFLPTNLFMQFSAMEISHLKEVFTVLDHDRSHAISLNEFESCLPEFGEYLSPSDLLWLFYQAHLDAKAEMNFIAFAQAIDTLKKARAERASLTRRILDHTITHTQKVKMSIFGQSADDIFIERDQAMKLRYGPWRRRRHPEMRSRIFWENTTTGECSYSMPHDIMFFISDDVRMEANMNSTALKRYEQLFAAVDTDSSGSIDAGEMRLVIQRMTGENLADSRIRGLIRQFDLDRNGSIDFNEFILILISIQKGKAGQQWMRLVQGLDEYRAARSNQADEILRDIKAAAKVHHRRRHNPYCVCGCRRIHPGQRERHRRRYGNQKIFPKIREEQLRHQAQIGGATAQATFDTNRNRVFHNKTYEAATLIASQERIEISDQSPKWSMIQTRRREQAALISRYKDCSSTSSTIIEEEEPPRVEMVNI
uniref:Calmodulin n=1 Tax=Aureoumbra lagunensis TaxID=44058 RepID=A0A7S3JUG7_9STRA